MGGGIFWVGGVGWKFFMSGWAWVDVFLDGWRWIGVGGGIFFRYFLRAGGSELVAVGGDIFWVGRGRWA